MKGHVAPPQTPPVFLNISFLKNHKTMPVEPEFRFMEKGANFCGECWVQGFAFLLLSHWMFLCGCVEGACQCNENLLLSCVGETRTPGRWDSHDCECKPICNNFLMYNLWGRNFGSLCHPFRCARLCYAPERSVMN